jgi:hypothetical protein
VFEAPARGAPVVDGFVMSRGGVAEVDSVWRADMSLPSFLHVRVEASNTGDDGAWQRGPDTHPSVDISSPLLSRKPSVSAAEGPFEAVCCDGLVLGRASGFSKASRSLASDVWGLLAGEMMPSVLCSCPI